jgi:pimeloyl-ACP methyl ester carboxylesterase
MGTSVGGRTALWLAAQHPERVLGLVLESPAAIRPEGARPPVGPPEEMARRLYAHPERMPPLAAPDPAVVAKQEALVGRLRGPARDPELERRLRDLATPTMVVFGTLDRIIPPEMGRHYKELMPNCHLVFVYDAGHAIGAERPEAFVDLVSDFLERHEGFVINRAETVIHP